MVQDSRFIWKHSDTYTSVTRGHFLNNIYIQDMTMNIRWKNNKSDSKYKYKVTT